MRALSNQTTADRLRRLERVRTDLLAAPVQTTRVRMVSIPRSGVIQAAIMEVLRTHDRPLRGRDIRALVETRLDQPISGNTVQSFLSVACRADDATVVRVGYGLYRMAP